MLRVIVLGMVLWGLAVPAAVFAQSRAGRDDALALERARYAVIVGEMRDATSFRGADLAPQLAEGVARRLRALGRVVVLHARDATADLLASMGRRRLPTLRVEGAVTSIERGDLAGQPSVRCQVALVLMDERGGALRSVLRGAATFAAFERGPRSQRDRRLVERALDRAVDSALSEASRVFSGAADRADTMPRVDGRLALRR